MEVGPQLAVEDEQGGEARGLGVSSRERGLAVGVDKAMLTPAPWEGGRLEGLDAWGVGLV